MGWHKTSFQDLLNLYDELKSLNKFYIQNIATQAMWIFHPRETYNHILGLKKLNRYDALIFDQIWNINMLTELAIRSDYRIILPEEKIYFLQDKLPIPLIQLLDLIRVYNQELRMNGNQQLDQTISLIFSDSREIIRRIKDKNDKVEYLGELIWMQGLLSSTWDLMGMKRKKYRKLDLRIKSRIVEFSQNEEIDEETRQSILFDYGESVDDKWHDELLDMFSLTSMLRLYSRKQRRKYKKKLDLLFSGDPQLLIVDKYW